MSDSQQPTLEPELIGAKLRDGSMAYLRPEAVLGLIPTEDGMQLLLVGGTRVSLLGSGGAVRRRLMGQPEPEPKAATPLASVGKPKVSVERRHHQLEPAEYQLSS